MKKLPIAVLVSGSGSNLQAIIDACESGKISGEIKVVISNNPDAFALTRCKKHKLKSAVYNHKDFPSKDAFEKEIIKVIEENGAGLVCLAGFMRVLSDNFVKHFSGKLLNIHPALLPSFPGLHGQKQALDYGVRYSGCTVHFVDATVDGGPIILQSVVPVEPNDTEETLAARILKEEHKIYPQAIQLFAEGRLKLRGRSVLIASKK